MNLFDIFATLSLDKSNYEEGLEGAESSASSFGGKLSSALGTAGKVGGAALAALGAGAVETSVAFVNGISDVGSYADNIDKMSQKLHMSAEGYQEWDFIMQHSGASIESMGTSMRTLTNALDSGSEAFETLGLSQEALSQMSQEEAFAATIEALQGVEDETQRTVLAQELLGRGSSELGALLNMTAEETAAMRQQAHDLGGVLSDDTVKAGAQFKDSLQNLKTVMGGLKNNMLGQFLPATSQVMDGLTAVFAGDSSGLQMIREGLTEFASQLEEVLPEMIEIGTGIITTLVEVIRENLPMLMDAAVQIIVTLVTKLTEPDMMSKVTTGITQVMTTLINGITQILPQLIPAVIQIITTIAMALIQPENLKAIITAAVDIVTSVATGISQNLDELIPAVLEAIITIATELVKPENLLKLITAAWDVVKAIGTGIAEALGFTTFANAVADIFNKVYNKVKELLDGAWGWGYDMIQNFANGIIAAADLCEDGIAYWAGVVDDYLGHSTPDKGPLKDDDEWGGDFAQNFIDGIRGKRRELQSAVFDTADIMATGFDNIGTAPEGTNGYGSVAGLAGGGQIVIPVYIGNEKLDELVVNANQRYDYISGGRG